MSEEVQEVVRFSFQAVFTYFPLPTLWFCGASPPAEPLMAELGSRCDQDVLVRSALLQVDGLLFLQHQETEQNRCRLQTVAAPTQSLQAEHVAAAVTLVLSHKNYLYQHYPT